MEQRKKHLIYCPVFRGELLAVHDQLSGLTFHELGYDVHGNSASMLKQLREALAASQAADAVPLILVGRDCECGIPIGDLAAGGNGCVPAHMNCLEIFLGKEKTLELQQNRTVLMTPGWLKMIAGTIADGLWTVENARMNLGWYDRILLLDTGVTPLTDEGIMEFYDLVRVPIEVMAIGLEHFRDVVKKMLC